MKTVIDYRALKTPASAADVRDFLKDIDGDTVIHTEEDLILYELKRPETKEERQERLDRAKKNRERIAEIEAEWQAFYRSVMGF